MRALLIPVSLLALVSACGQDTAPPPVEQSPAAEQTPPVAGAEPAPRTTDERGAAAAAVIAGDWRLVNIAGKAVPDDLDPPTLLVQEDGQVAGFAGVNRYKGQLGGPAGRLFGPMPTTMMAGPAKAMDLEARYSRAMGEATDFRLKGDVLTIVSEGADLVFERVE